MALSGQVDTKKAPSPGTIGNLTLISYGGNTSLLSEWKLLANEGYGQD